MNLTKSIEIAKAHNGWSDSQCASQLKMSRSNWSVLKRRNHCTTPKLYAISFMFGMKVSEFVALGE